MQVTHISFSLNPQLNKLHLKITSWNKAKKQHKWQFQVDVYKQTIYLEKAFDNV